MRVGTGHTYLARACVAIVCVLLLAGCGAKKQSSEQASASKKDKGGSMSTLVLNGEVVSDGDGEGDHVGDGRVPDGGDDSTSTTNSTTKLVWPKPELNPDGTLDAGADPFEGDPIEVQPLPVEDDPDTTFAVDKWSRMIRRIDAKTWDDWMSHGVLNPFRDDPDTMADHMVRVSVERCGGARTVASGVVLEKEMVVTSVHVIESASKRVWIKPALGDSPRIAAMVRYLDVDDDVAVLKVPGLQMTPMPILTAKGDTPRQGYAYGIQHGTPGGVFHRVGIIGERTESVISRDQPDGFAEQISDRSVIPFVGAVDTGFSGGVITMTNDKNLYGGWGFMGLIRARMPFRSDTAGIAVPARIVEDDLDASDKLDPWFEIKPGGCPQWHRHKS